MRYSMLTYREISLRASDGAIALIPLGCTEQQGPHLTVGFDTWFTEELCVAAADAVRASHELDVIVLPVLPFGPTPEHRGFGAGFVDLPERVHDAVVAALLGSLADQGFIRMLFLRGCGQHDLQAVVATFNREMKGRAIAHLPDQPFGAIWCRVADPAVAGGHADSFTTSVALFRHPEQVRLDLIPCEPSAIPDWDDPELDFTRYSTTGVIGDATHASVELGEALWDASVKALVEMLHGLMKSPVIAAESRSP